MHINKTMELFAAFVGMNATNVMNVIAEKRKPEDVHIGAMIKLLRDILNDEQLVVNALFEAGKVAGCERELLATGKELFEKQELDKMNEFTGLKTSLDKILKDVQ